MNRSLLAFVLFPLFLAAAAPSGKDVIQFGTDAYCSDIKFTKTRAEAEKLKGRKIRPGAASAFIGTGTGKYLYTKPTPDATGGISGRIVGAPSSVEGVIAIIQRFRTVSALSNVKGGTAAKNGGQSASHMKFPCYLADLDDNNNFSFRGLPPGKYDLVVICEDRMYDGIRLSREETTLSKEDLRVIDAKVKESNPFFDTKKICRMEGTTGRLGAARAVVQELRTKAFFDQYGSTYDNLEIRSIKLFIMDSVGGGKMGTHWEVQKVREICRKEVGGVDTRGALPEIFLPALQGIRVSKSVKDVGEISLKK